MLLRLHHAQINVPSSAVDAARDFYCGVLGLTEIEKPEALKPRGGFWLELGEVQIHIGVESQSVAGSSRAHLAYLVDDLDHWRARLSRTGSRSLTASRSRIIGASNFATPGRIG